jgi:hypothetical protein
MAPLIRFSAVKGGHPDSKVISNATFYYLSVECGLIINEVPEDALICTDAVFHKPTAALE